MSFLKWIFTTSPFISAKVLEGFVGTCECRFKAEYLCWVGVGLRLWDVRVVDVKHVIADHLLPHSAGPLRHFQHKLVQVGADWRAPEASFTQQLVFDGCPLLRHVLEGILLPLRDGEDGRSKSAVSHLKKILLWIINVTTATLGCEM